MARWKRATHSERLRNLTESFRPGWRRRPAVCVLGPHRSGTSPVTRVVNLLGVYLGADGDLIPGRPDNPAGFWEHSGLVYINERILEHFDGVEKATGDTWSDPPRFPDGWEASPELRAIAWRARVMLRMHFGAAKAWGWKDPRTSLTLPFWQRLVPEMRYVICVRNPSDVAESLAGRSGITPDQGYQLWLRYMNAAVAHTAGRPRLFVGYEALLGDTQLELERLGTFVTGQKHPCDRLVASAVMAYLDDSLWHHRSGFDDDNGMPEAVRDLYRAVSAEATRPAETEMNTPAGGRRFEERAEIGDHVRTHTEHEHRTRYLWASKRLSGRVLDVACGNGHGSALLARTSDVTGIDRDELATATARARVPAGMFQVSDVPPIPYPDGAFAHAVCFETVEHVADDIAFIRELRRVIAPGGHLLISTPNRAVTSPNETRPSNPYHVREYLLPEFLRLVSDAGFERIVIYFQRKERRRVPEFVASAVIARIPRLCQPGRWWDRLGHGSSDVEPWTEDVTHPQFWVLDCS